MAEHWRLTAGSPEAGRLQRPLLGTVLHVRHCLDAIGARVVEQVAPQQSLCARPDATPA
jgi:hypothetical protein